MSFRSSAWLDGVGLTQFFHRSSLKATGLPRQVFEERPTIGIITSFSDLNPCNAHLRQLTDHVKAGVWQAGGLPFEVPTISLGEPFIKPTAMMHRNLMAMDVEEMIVSNPIDAVVVLGGCDKTTAAQLMGAASADLPTVFVTGGPMLKGRFGDNWIGSGTDGFELWRSCGAGEISEDDFVEAEACIARSAGHCMTMGTASTMACLVEALGLSLPGAAAIPAADSRRGTIAHLSGIEAVRLAREDVTFGRIVDRHALENALTALMAIGGSTNAVIHLLALAGRVEEDIKLEDFDAISRRTPVLANIKPSGDLLMEDFFYAGGLPSLQREIADLLHLDQPTVNGHTVGENLAGAPLATPSTREVIRPRESPLQDQGGLAVLRGNLAPDGAVIKQSAASPELLRHSGPAVVFHSRVDMLERIHRPDLEVTADSVLVLQNVGPVGGPGMPEWGMMPIPRKLAEQGVRDMVRLSDARMSGTAYGTVVLHIAPESAIGGPLGAVRSGDMITLDVAERKLEVALGEGEIEARKVAHRPRLTRGYPALFEREVLQADHGCDFAFLQGRRTGDLPRQYAGLGHS